MPSTSIYGATLRALTDGPTQCLDALRSLDITNVDNEVAHTVFAKVMLLVRDMNSKFHGIELVTSHQRSIAEAMKPQAMLSRQSVARVAD